MPSAYEIQPVPVGVVGGDRRAWHRDNRLTEGPGSGDPSANVDDRLLNGESFFRSRTMFTSNGPRAGLQDVWSERSGGLNGIVATTIEAYVGGVHLSAIHHSVIAVGDLGASLRFYRDGLGLDVLQDRKVEGDWPALFDGPSRTLHAVFLGDAHVPDVSAGVLELIDFPDSSIPTSSSDPAPTTGLFQLSFFVDVEATLKKLADLELGGPPRRVAQSTPNGPITVATVRDPDGVLVLLTPGSITQRR